MKLSFALGMLSLAMVAAACESGEPSESRSKAPAEPPVVAKQAQPNATEINPRILRRFRPVVTAPNKVERPIARIDLGRLLWYDARLSKDKDLSCNSCHELAGYGVDSKRVSIGHQGAVGTRNAPTVYNAGGHFALFWDGRAGTVEEQAPMPILNPAEMALEKSELVARLRAIPEYRKRFASAFPGEKNPVSVENVGRALGAFERGLRTESRWDRYLEGKKSALSADEIAGLRLFINLGCLTCHTGPEVGATMFQRVGVIEPWPNRDDRGRYDVTENPVDDMVFKVPSLKNIAMTAPYFHDGSATDLATAIRMMAKHQLGKELDDAEVRSIETFFSAFTGPVPADYIREPDLPMEVAHAGQ